jgi:hypothetical protein
LRQIELLPLQAGDLLAALAGQRQELDNTSIRTTNPSSGEDDLSEFFVVQNSVSTDFSRRQRHPFGRGSIKDGSTYAPAQERLDRLQGLVGSAEGAALFNGGNDFNDISLTDLMDAPADPGLSHLPTKKPGNFVDRAVL